MHRFKNIIYSTPVLLLCLLSGNHSIVAQSLEVHLDEVQILGSRKSSYTSDLHTLRIDSLLKTKYFGCDLSRILKDETNLNITQYGGQGSLASIRLRGSAPSQTQINWNGIPVNSPTTGSIDLSLLSGGMADAIEVAYGAGGSLFGNGTFGGSINLFNQPDWNNRFSINVAGEAGSWNHLKTGINFRAGNKVFQYHLSGLYQSSPNTYSYRNTFKTGSPVEYRMNDSVTLAALQQHIFIRLPRNWFIQYGLWIHGRDKQLPSSMSSTPMFRAYQEDQSIRQFVRIARWFRKSAFEILAAHFTDSLLYRERAAAKDSVLKQSGIRSAEVYLSFSHRWFISNSLSWENGADFEYQTAKVQAYNGKVDESRGAFFSLLKFKVKQFSTSLSYRQVISTMAGPKPVFSASIQYHPTISGFSFRGQISNKFRFPTLNDRYWQPGGNPLLLPETGMGYDLGFSWNSKGSSGSKIIMSSMLFIQQINNWIQWVPSGTYWTPQNIRRVNCKGLELDLSGRFKAGQAGITGRAMYTYTESFDMSQPPAETRYLRQLSYVPLHLLKLQAGIEFRQFEASFCYKFTGRRFTTDNHDPWLDLDPYHLADFSVSHTFSMKKSKVIVSGHINNLFNAGYQLIRAYPAPGRSFYVSVNYLFNQIQDKNE